MAEFENDRAVTVTVDGTEYPMLFTMLANREIGKRYGGVSHICETLLEATKTGAFGEEETDAIAWLVALLANQPIMRQNLNNTDKKPLLTEDDILLASSPYQMPEYFSAILDAFGKGNRRNVKSEDAETETKNAESA